MNIEFLGIRNVKRTNHNNFKEIKVSIILRIQNNNVTVFIFQYVLETTFMSVSRAFVINTFYPKQKLLNDFFVFNF